MNKENYIRKSHSFTKEALDDLNVLNRYMGDIGESAVLRYLIINEIRKVPNSHNHKQVHTGITEEGLQAMLRGQLEHLMDKSKEELAKAEIEGLDDDANSCVLGMDEE